MTRLVALALLLVASAIHAQEPIVRPARPTVAVLNHVDFPQFDSAWVSYRVVASEPVWLEWSTGDWVQVPAGTNYRVTRLSNSLEHDSGFALLGVTVYGLDGVPLAGYAWGWPE